jgi:hypothetical protein
VPLGVDDRPPSPTRDGGRPGAGELGSRHEPLRCRSRGAALEARPAGRRGGVSGLGAATARIVRGRVMTSLTVASSVVINAVERLCDHDLCEAEREYSTDQLYAAGADVRLALAELAEWVGASEHVGDRADVVVRISRSRFRRHGLSRRL